MKSFFLILFFLAGFAGKQHPSSKQDLVCTLTSDKPVYKVGELPRLDVRIENHGKKDIYLIGSLDGSDVKWRFPYCYFSIQKSTPGNTPVIARCGNMNTLELADFRLVGAGQSFDPYESNGDHGFFSDYRVTNKETFETPGTYRIRFYYSTNAQDLSEFRGDRWPRNTETDSSAIDALFKQVPRVELASNEVTIRVEE